MEVIARIPSLPCAAAMDAWQPTTPGGRIPAEAKTDEAPAEPRHAAEEPPPAPRPPAEPRRPRRAAGGRRPAAALLSPSVVTLAAVAAAVWTAAWRNERLRAIEQRQPHRVALEPQPTAGPERSVTP
jgi:hypothetical protein